MCGILGTLPATKSYLFKHALDSLIHRGPDGFGIWHEEEGAISLGHRRLAILDLSENGHQPMNYERYVITFNGEIYNFLEIRKELEKKGYNFRTESDTEVILAAYHEWKENCLLKFNGMWALAIWDKIEKQLFLSRDRYGQKPLFYCFTKGTFVFASEMKAITPFLPDIKPSKDFHWCKENYFQYETTEKSLIEGIKRFPSGHYSYLDLKNKSLSPVCYWETINNLQEVPKSYEDQVLRFRELFIDSCKLRMRSDVPIGTALSGGLDSSATICTMAHTAKTSHLTRESKDWQHAFVATFPDTFLDESKYAKTVVDYLDIPATFIPINPAAGIENLENYLYLFEELYLTSPIPMMELYGAVKANNVTVTLDGHGADELIAGYGQDVFSAFIDAGLNIKEVKNILDTYRGLYSLDHPQAKKIDIGFLDYLRHLKYKHKGYKDVFSFFAKNLLGLQKKEKAHIGQFGRYNTRLFEIFHQSTLPTLLRNYDRYSMASGVEIRMPFMDHRLITYCFSLSWKAKLRKGYTKAILRDALKDIMPEAIVLRKSKMGFNTPIVNWMQNEWKEFLLDHINSDNFKHCSLINSKETKAKVEKVINTPKINFGAGEEAWVSLMPYLWEQSFIKRAIQAKRSIS